MGGCRMVRRFAGFGGGCSDQDWVRVSVVGAGIVNCVFTPQAKPERPENHSRQCPHPEPHRTYPKRFRTSANDPAPISDAPAARPDASITPRALVASASEQMTVTFRRPCLPPHTLAHHSSSHRKRRVFSGSGPAAQGGGDAHSFMTFGLCTRNEKCALAPIPNQALPRYCPRGLHAGCPAGCS